MTLCGMDVAMMPADIMISAACSCLEVLAVPLRLDNLPDAKRTSQLGVSWVNALFVANSTLRPLLQGPF
jgi:hypothetical protein